MNGEDVPLTKHTTPLPLWGGVGVGLVLHPLPPSAAGIAPPEHFTYPFCYNPHPLCKLAAEEVVRYCYSNEAMRPREGKMFGVLVVEGGRYLAAFSGIYNGSYHHEGFVPPVFDLQSGYFPEEEQRIVSITQQIERMAVNGLKDPNDLKVLSDLKALRKSKSRELQMWAFRQFRMLNARGETKDLLEIFANAKSPCSVEEYRAYKRGQVADKPKAKVGIPPGGSGECCAPKLLQYAYAHGLKPLCMAEFWVGPPQKETFRTEGNYYAACQHKCKPILTFMLQGLDVEENPVTRINTEMASKVQTVYEDEYIMVVNKPSGLLSVPSKDEAKTLIDIIHDTYPDAQLAHRLDMDTSGLVIVAKNTRIAAMLQEQFAKREVKKRYVAIVAPLNPPQVGGLEKLPSTDDKVTSSLPPSGGETEGGVRGWGAETAGTISLPLSKNPFDSPRQIVDYEFGKPSTTRYEFVDDNRVLLYPETGRTHQLRVHCAHPDGLNRPIKGDRLYGTLADRLYLHAESIDFRHPITGQPMHFTAPPEF